MRRFFLRLHLWLGVPLGVIISVICFSGACLVFEQEITRGLTPELSNVSRGDRQMTPSEIAASHAELQIQSITYPAVATEPCLVTLADRTQLSLDPYTGRVLGRVPSYAFFSTMKKLHRWLMDEPAARGEMSAGKMIVGIAVIVLLLALATGVVVWIPKSVKALKIRLSVRRKTLLHDAHTSLGIYAVVLLLLMALTGLTWSFGWYRNAVYSLFGASETTSQPFEHQAFKSENKKPEGRPQGGRPERFEHEINFSSWDKALKNLQSEYAVYQSITIADGTAQVAADPTTSMRKLDNVTFDKRSGRIEDIKRYRDSATSQRMRGWLYALHTGIWGGGVTKIIYFIVALIGASLPITGYCIWIRRKRKK